MARLDWDKVRIETLDERERKLSPVPLDFESWLKVHQRRGRAGVTATGGGPGSPPKPRQRTARKPLKIFISMQFYLPAHVGSADWRVTDSLPQALSILNQGEQAEQIRNTIIDRVSRNILTSRLNLKLAAHPPDDALEIIQSGPGQPATEAAFYCGLMVSTNLIPEELTIEQKHRRLAFLFEYLNAPEMIQAFQSSAQECVNSGTKSMRLHISARIESERSSDPERTCRKIAAEVVRAQQGALASKHSEEEYRIFKERAVRKLNKLKEKADDKWEQYYREAREEAERR